MAIDFITFKTKYPELVACGDANEAGITDCISDSVLILGSLSLCPKLSEGITLAHAAHCVAKSGHNPEGADDSPGPVSSNSVGSVSASYQANGTSQKSGSMASYYASTVYGRKYQVLIRYCKGSGVMTAP